MSSQFPKIVSFIRKLYNTPEGLIPLHAPVFGGNEKIFLNECIDSTFVSSIGHFVEIFEEQIASYTGAKKAVSCVNGTCALHLALRLVGVEQGHEVITQPLTFIATANAIAYCGAEPVFLDVDRDTMGLSPASLRNFLETNTYCDTSSHKLFNAHTKRPITACIPMHTFGYPCRIDELVDICDQYGLPVVEDAAESMGSFYKGQHTGTFGQIGVLSFNGNKILTTGGGGMMLFQDENLAKRAKHLTTQARLLHPWNYFHDEIGYNYRMPNINAAIGCAQFEQLNDFLEIKRENAKKYKNFFEKNGIEFISEPMSSCSNYWLVCILLKDRIERDNFLQYSNNNGIMTRPAWELINNLNIYKHCQTGDLKNAITLSEKLVNIPSSAKKKN